MRPFLVLATFLVTLAAGPHPGRADVRNPHGIAVIIGNKTYQRHGIPEVKYADRDAQAIRDYVIDVLGYANDNIIWLPNATESNLLSVFGSADDPRGKLARYLWGDGKSDVFVYYSGHGAPGLGDGQAYLLPVDADPNAASQTGYSLDLLRRNLQKLNARSVTVLLEAGFSGASAGGPLLADAPAMTRPANPLPPAGVGKLTWIAAAGPDQLANWDNKHRHGLFTEYFLEAVYGRADDPQYGGLHDGRIRLAAVREYLDEEMSHAARREIGHFQTATISGDAGVVLATLTPDRQPVQHDEEPPTVAPAPTAKGADAGDQIGRMAIGGAGLQMAMSADETALTGDEAFQLSDSDRRLVQQWLAAAGHDPGGTDGVFGPSARAAIIAYQRSIGAPPTGTLTADEFAHLRDDGAAQEQVMTQMARPHPPAKPTQASAPQGQADDLLRQGNAARDRKDYAAALNLFRRAASGGDADAMNELGMLYDKGEGVKKNYAVAMRWFRRAADKGNILAMRNVGLLYKAGAGTPRDLNEARNWLNKAAELGDQQSRDELAKL
jgi:peptidoglycan hydrolase-like protein with peptidoglycan-binding domain